MSGIFAIIGFIALITGAWPAAIVFWVLALLFDSGEKAQSDEPNH
jgi:hypothetical protein